MTTVATPRPTTATGRVYPYLKDGIPRPIIERETGLAGMRLTYAIRANYRLGYLPTPSLAERRQRLRSNTSAGKGGVWLVIRDYAPLCLTARQTQVAVKYYHGRRLSLSQIASAYQRERHRNHLQRPVAELTGEAQRDKRRSWRALLGIVRHRLAVNELLTEEGIGRPVTLCEWVQLSCAQKLTELGIVKRTCGEWQATIRLYERSGRPLDQIGLRVEKRAERAFIERCMQQERQLLERLFAGDCEKLPTEPGD
ncbi:MAG TPA: hypothetical protein VK821_09430 [Dehalococcoidia bacterium]|nr:hypothetical protein [Dehalococcoidia bacterium]